MIKGASLGKSKNSYFYIPLQINNKNQPGWLVFIKKFEN